MSSAAAAELIEAATAAKKNNFPCIFSPPFVVPLY
jgi:hypothetical protein